MRMRRDTTSGGRVFGRQVLIVAFTAAALLAARPAAAQNNPLGLREQGRYDLYFSGNQSLNLIRNVEIVDVRKIEGRLFIAIEADAFASKRSEALIAFDAVQAVIPTQMGLRVEAAPPSNYR